MAAQTQTNPTSAATTTSAGTGTGASRYASLATSELNKASEFNNNQVQTATGETRTTTMAPTTTTISRGTPATQAALEILIAQLRSGGTPEYKAQLAKKAQSEDFVKQLMASYTTGRAFEEAKGLMALNLQQAMEKNLPAIARSVEGAGTSASSMQGLLTQNLSRDAALAASALGAEQAKVYAGTTASLAGSMLGSTSRVYDDATKSLVNALQLAQQGTETQTKTGGGNTETSSPTTTITTRTPNLPADGLSVTGGIDTGTLDPLRYYSQLGMSGSGKKIFDFVKGL